MADLKGQVMAKMQAVVGEMASYNQLYQSKKFDQAMAQEDSIQASLSSLKRIIDRLPPRDRNALLKKFRDLQKQFQQTAAEVMRAARGSKGAVDPLTAQVFQSQTHAVSPMQRPPTSGDSFGSTVGTQRMSQTAMPRARGDDPRGMRTASSAVGRARPRSGVENTPHRQGATVLGSAEGTSGRQSARKTGEEAHKEALTSLEAAVNKMKREGPRGSTLTMVLQSALDSARHYQAGVQERDRRVAGMKMEREAREKRTKEVEAELHDLKVSMARVSQQMQETESTDAIRDRLRCLHRDVDSLSLRLNVPAPPLMVKETDDRVAMLAYECSLQRSMIQLLVMKDSERDRMEAVKSRGGTFSADPVKETKEKVDPETLSLPTAGLTGGAEEREETKARDSDRHLSQTARHRKRERERAKEREAETPAMVLRGEFGGSAELCARALMDLRRTTSALLLNEIRFDQEPLLERKGETESSLRLLVSALQTELHHTRTQLAVATAVGLPTKSDRTQDETMALGSLVKAGLLPESPTARQLSDLADSALAEPDMLSLAEMADLCPPKIIAELNAALDACTLSLDQAKDRHSLRGTGDAAKELGRILRSRDEALSQIKVVGATFIEAAKALVNDGDEVGVGLASVTEDVQRIIKNTRQKKGDREEETVVTGGGTEVSASLSLGLPAPKTSGTKGAAKGDESFDSDYDSDADSDFVSDSDEYSDSDGYDEEREKGRESLLAAYEATASDSFVSLSLTEAETFRTATDKKLDGMTELLSDVQVQLQCNDSDIELEDEKIVRDVLTQHSDALSVMRGLVMLLARRDIAIKRLQDILTASLVTNDTQRAQLTRAAVARVACVKTITELRAETENIRHTMQGLTQLLSMPSTRNVDAISRFVMGVTANPYLDDRERASLKGIVSLETQECSGIKEEIQATVDEGLSDVQRLMGLLLSGVTRYCRKVTSLSSRAAQTESYVAQVDQCVQMGPGLEAEAETPAKEEKGGRRR
ncbi:hypothetical protein KIPB_004165 [Kipferlia bialata]|uniref:Uncharacterized protein n=1 Tax=Kipferlia bialata TaxID=797122 RepID=A0A9K3GGC7_9EUKA|nr:hypothetical protein KIPB_004165 [Kipferlia bialata]|eukprot:g4165.t1